MSFRAMYDGTCAAGCPMRIHPGDQIVREPDGSPFHAECAPPRAPAPAMDVRCVVCGRPRPCRCDE